MTQQITRPIQLPDIEPAPRTLGTQAQALLAATLLAEAFPQMAGVNLTFSRSYPGEVSIHAGSLVEVEAWRVALGADPSAVDSRWIGRDLELFFEVPKFGALVRVFAMDVVASGTSGVAA
ncbi:hypothetical protein [Streptomyces sp. YIM S03343]